MPKQSRINDSNAPKLTKKDETAEALSLLTEHHRYLREEPLWIVQQE